MAISLAGNVVQFTQTASTVVCLVRDLYNSTSGSSGDVERIKETYSMLQDIHTRLKPGGAPVHGPEATANRPEEEDLIKLAARCEAKCAELVNFAAKQSIRRRGRLRGISMIRWPSLSHGSRNSKSWRRRSMTSRRQWS